MVELSWKEGGVKLGPTDIPREATGRGGTSRYGVPGGYGYLFWVALRVADLNKVKAGRLRRGFVSEARILGISFRNKISAHL